MKKILIIIGVVVVCFAALLSFTNIGDPIIDSISQIETKNPFATDENKYEINSKQDLVCLITTKTYPSPYSGLSYSERLNPEDLELKYPNEITMIKRMETSGYHDEIINVYIPILIAELSINPDLELFMYDTMSDTTLTIDELAVDEFEKLAKNCP